MPPSRIVYVRAHEPQSTGPICATMSSIVVMITLQQTAQFIRLRRIGGARECRRPERSFPVPAERGLSSVLMPLIIEKQRFIQRFEELFYRPCVNWQPKPYS